MESSFYYKEMEEYVSVVDVYDSAALIGKDFEYLIEQYGVEAVTDLMPKVIRVLEQLEFLAAKNEKENDELMQLELTIKRLSSEKEERTKERQRYEQDLEQIEESYRKETKDLCQMVSNLQDQNKRLQSRLNEKSSGQEAAVEKSEEDFNVIQSLKETITKQRGQIKGLQNEVKHKESEIDTISTHIERLTQDNLSLRSTSSSFQSETENLLRERDLLQNTLREKDSQITSIHEKISQQEKSLNDSQDEVCGTTAEKNNIIGQVVGNTKDPDAPRFTLNELKDVLTERNTLKSKLIEMEEELSYYKSKDKPAEDSDTSSSWQTEQVVTDPDDQYTGDVEGPLPPEPWEKVHAKPESGIRKFFERFPVELPDTIKVNLVPGELASYAQARASSFWDLRTSRGAGAEASGVEADTARRSRGSGSALRTERPKSEFLPSNSKI